METQSATFVLDYTFLMWCKCDVNAILFFFLILPQEIRQQSCELPCRVAKLPENKTRNRYRDVSPCKLLFCPCECTGQQSSTVSNIQNTSLYRRQLCDRRFLLDYQPVVADSLKLQQHQHCCRAAADDTDMSAYCCLTSGASIAIVIWNDTMAVLHNRQSIASLWMDWGNRGFDFHIITLVITSLFLCIY